MSRPRGFGLVGLAIVVWAGWPAHATGQFPPEFYIESMVGQGAQVFLGPGPYARLGLIVAAGDVNADGFVDLLAASHGVREGPVWLNAVYVVFWGAWLWELDVFDLRNLNGSNGFRIDALTPEDDFGSALLSGVDLNGDGIEDMVVGTPIATPEPPPWLPNGGQVFVIFGAPGLGATGTFDLRTLDGANGFVINGPGILEFAGVELRALDFNADGWSDLAIYTYGPGNRGRVFVLWGHPELGRSGHVDLWNLLPGEALRIDGVQAGDYAGLRMARGGDFNADGVTDLLIGASGADPNGIQDAGQAYVLFGRPGWEQQEVFWLGDLDASTGFVMNGPYPDASARVAVATLGDVNVDGYDDLQVMGGGTFIVFGGPQAGASGPIELGQLDGRNGFEVLITGGGRPAGAFDLNHDGIADFAPGRVSPTQPSAPVVYGAPGLGATGVLSPSELDGNSGFIARSSVYWRHTIFGYRAFSLGDFNSDGIDDLAIPDPAYDRAAQDPDMPDAGAVYVLFGRRLGDLDLDADVDLADFLIFQRCFGGEEHPPTPDCPTHVLADLDYDGDVDLADFLILQLAFTGSQNGCRDPLGPSCGGGSEGEGEGLGPEGSPSGTMPENGPEQWYWMLYEYCLANGIPFN